MGCQKVSKGGRKVQKGSNGTLFLLADPGYMIQLPKGLVLANNKHKYLGAPKLRNQFSVNHDKIQFVDYKVFINTFHKIC